MMMLGMTACTGEDNENVSTNNAATSDKTEMTEIDSTTIIEPESATEQSTEQTLSSGDYDYVIISDNQIALTNYSGKDKAVTVPSEIDGKKVTELRETFSYRNTIEKIILPETVSKLDSDVFFKCIDLKSIEVDENNSNFSSVDGVLYDKEVETLLYYPDNKTDSIFSVPQSVKKISFLCKEPKYKMIVIYSSVEKIENAPEYSDSVWVVTKDSAAEKFAKEKHLRYIYMNIDS